MRASGDSKAFQLLDYCFARCARCRAVAYAVASMPPRGTMPLALHVLGYFILSSALRSLILVL